jgi:hypothetical protein
MDEMVEQVARAMAASEPKLAYWDDKRSMARAAIAAMRDPSEAMLDATKALSSSRAYVGDVWRAMIDAALRD